MTLRLCGCNNSFDSVLLILSSLPVCCAVLGPCRGGPLSLVLKALKRSAVPSADAAQSQQLQDMWSRQDKSYCRTFYHDKSQLVGANSQSQPLVPPALRPWVLLTITPSPGPFPSLWPLNLCWSRQTKVIPWPVLFLGLLCLFSPAVWEVHPSVLKS